MNSNHFNTSNRSNVANDESAHPADHPLVWLSYLEGRLDPSQAEQVETHVIICGECRDEAAVWRRLDAQLETQIRRPALPAGFKESFLAKLEMEADGQRSKGTAVIVSGGPTEIVGVERISFWSALPGALDILAGCSAVGLALCGLYRLAPGLERAGHLADFIAPKMFAGLITGSVILGMGCWFAVRSRYSRSLASL